MRKYLELTVRLPDQYTEEDFRNALAMAERVLDDWLRQPIAPLPAPPIPPPASPAPKALESTQHPSALFPEDLRELLEFTDKGEYWEIKPRKFLGSGNFAKVAHIVREHGGEYYPAGKESHFKIPKREDHGRGEELQGSSGASP
ncbi:hypothetical protein KEJ32_07290 [Candidatus Bathyarchaeota archaeon]|nr:hypothetical protein [Candidatus Bathyarchaeota archaeon]